MVYGAQRVGSSGRLARHQAAPGARFGFLQQKGQVTTAHFRHIAGHHEVPVGIGDGQCRQETASRPEGGLLLGDLDDVPFAFVDSGTVDDTPRFTGDGTADAVARVDPQPPPGEDVEGPVPGALDAACFGSPAYRWEVHIEVDVADGVLSGTVLRIPEELRTTVDGTECFGIDLTLGLSGTPSDGSGDSAPG